MSQIIERTGRATVLLGDDPLADGSYHLFVELSPSESVAGSDRAASAWGTVRLADGRSVSRAMKAAVVRVRLDWETEVLVTVVLYVPEAAFFAFTSSDLPALSQMIGQA